MDGIIIDRTTMMFHCPSDKRPKTINYIVGEHRESNRQKASVVKHLGSRWCQQMGHRLFNSSEDCHFGGS